MMTLRHLYNLYMRIIFATIIMSLLCEYQEVGKYVKKRKVTLSM